MDERSTRLLRAVTATVSGDTSSVSELFTEDVVAVSPTATVCSRVELAVELEDHEDEVSDVELDLGPVVTNGDRVCAEWVARALQTVTTGARCAVERVTLRGMSVAEFDGDRIRALRHYWNVAGPTEPE